jgi:hypothetical protein
MTPAKIVEVSVMRKFLVFALLVVVCLIGLGFYLGVFALSSSSDPETGRTTVQLSIGRMR